MQAVPPRNPLKHQVVYKILDDVGPRTNVFPIWPGRAQPGPGGAMRSEILLDGDTNFRRFAAPHEIIFVALMIFDTKGPTDTALHGNFHAHTPAFRNHPARRAL